MLDHSANKRFAAGGSAEFVLKRIRDIPALPEVVNRIIQLLGKPNTPASEIARLISLDPGLTSRVLRMVNSAAYGVNRQISSIQHGIMILGFNTVRGLVLSASIFKLFKANQGYMDDNTPRLDHKAFWVHSLATAIVAKGLAKIYQMPQVGEDAFSAGMLHDIGKIVLNTYFPDDYAEVLHAAQIAGIPGHGPRFYNLELEILGGSHCDVGGFISEKWRLPVNLTEVIRYHHQPERSLHSQPLVYTIAMANTFVRMYHLEGEIRLEEFSPAIIDYFDLDEDILGMLLNQVQKELDGVADMLSSISEQQERTDF